jgi:hypothetical protein
VFVEVDDIDTHTIPTLSGNLEALDLETRLEVYLVEWRREFSIREWPEAGIDCRYVLM